MHDEPTEPQSDRGQQPEILERKSGLQQAAEISVIAAPFVAPIVSEVAHKLLNPTPKEQPPQVILPPGVDPEK